MKKSELLRILREEIKTSLKENTLSSTQHQLLKDLYNTIKPYYQSLDNNQIIATLNELIDVYREEIDKILSESPNLDMINRSLNLLDKAADMAIKNPTGDVTKLANIIKKYTADIRESL